MRDIQAFISASHSILPYQQNCVIPGARGEQEDGEANGEGSGLNSRGEEAGDEADGESGGLYAHLIQKLVTDEEWMR